MDSPAYVFRCIQHDPCITCGRRVGTVVRVRLRGCITMGWDMLPHPRGTKTIEYALDAITETLVDYVRTALAPVEQGGAGLDGVFYAETGMASRGYFTHEQFLKLARPYDERILEAVGDGVKLLHTCRDHANPDWFADYDIDFLQWDQYVPGNPPISDDFNAVAVGGPDAVLIGEGTDADELRHQVKATIDERQGKPFLLAPSCTIPPRPDDEHLRILREA